MYWICARCGETYYTADTTGLGEPQPCETCGSFTAAIFGEDPGVDSPACILSDREGRVIAISRRMEALSGWSELEAIGMNADNLIAELGPDVVFRELETLTGSTLTECHVGVAIA